MRKLFGVAVLAISVVVCGLSIQNASAVSPNLVISRVQTKSLSGGSASQELVEIYNNSDSDTDITKWCIEYGQKAVDLITVDPLATSSLTCFNSSRGGDDKVLVSGRSTILLISKVMNDIYPLLGYDTVFNSGLADNDRWIRIKNIDSTIVDKVEWSGAGGVVSISAEGGKTAPAQTSTLIIQRKVAVLNSMQDTDNNYNDFIRSAAPINYSYGSIYEIEDSCTNIPAFQSIVPLNYTTDGAGNCVPPPVDICTNIDGMQATVPDGYALDSANLCQSDICKNLTGLQLEIPFGQILDVSGNCVEYDFCVNLSGIQAIVPVGYALHSLNMCMLDILPIRINELLANAIGSDVNNEFIELYNPNNSAVDLSLYVLKVGIDLPKAYTFPLGSVIEPDSYITFYDKDISFTLVNSTSQVSLFSIDDQLINQVPPYNNPVEGMAWALVDTSWQYTNQPTPGFNNVSSNIQDDDIAEVVTGLQPCALNQYRSLETNRCRIFITAGSSLTPCKDGQYRSEETNRCRSIASESKSLATCAANQYRNPETNRCRLLARSDTGLVACKDGQERSPETNRCRNVAGTIPDVGFAVQPISDTSTTVIGWWVVGGVGVIALGYAGWEWREEVLRAVRRVGVFFQTRR